MRTLFVAIFVVLLVVGGIILYFRWQERQENAHWEAAMADEDEEREAHVRETRHASVQEALAALRADDDAFSAVLFEDFAYALYAAAHTHRGARTLDRLAPYLSDSARKSYDAYPAREVSAIVVGGMRFESITTHSKRVQVELVFTSNMSEKDEKGATQAYYMEERWTLVRDGSVKSRPPEKARVIGCPSCGAPVDKVVAAKCGYCGAVATLGETDWFVEAIDVGARDKVGPMLTGTTEEVGTDWPTVVARDAKKEMEALIQRDPAFQWRDFVKRVEHVFHAFHQSWVAQELKGVRPFLSDNLYELQQYWVAAYQAQQLRNVTENPTVVTVHLAKIGRDKYYESITVRVFASCVDYTVDSSGAVVGGKKGETREYSEYWTFIRGVGKSGPRVVRSVDACPSCGAPIADVEMSGKCPHCNAKVTSGEFDWVLSRIEQDEVYDRVA